MIHKTLHFCFDLMQCEWADRKRLMYSNSKHQMDLKAVQVSVHLYIKNKAFTMMTSHSLKKYKADLVSRRGPTCINHPWLTFFSKKKCMWHYITVYMNIFESKIWKKFWKFEALNVWYVTHSIQRIYYVCTLCVVTWTRGCLFYIWCGWSTVAFSRKMKSFS